MQLAGVGGIEDADSVADGGEVGTADADGVGAGVLDVVAAPDLAPLVFAGDDLELELDVASAAVAGGLHVRVGDDGLVLAFGQGLELLGGLHFIGVEIDGCHCLCSFCCGLVRARGLCRAWRWGFRCGGVFNGDAARASADMLEPDHRRPEVVAGHVRLLARLDGVLADVAYLVMAKGDDLFRHLPHPLGRARRSPQRMPP